MFDYWISLNQSNLIHKLSSIKFDWVRLPNVRLATPGLVRCTHSKPSKMFQMLSAIFKQCPAKVLHGSETEAVAPNEDFWIKEGLDGGFKCQLSVKILAICQLLVNPTQTLIKGPGETSLKYMTHHYKNYSLWSEGSEILCLKEHFS